MNAKLKMALRWARYASSRSYYHVLQGLGRCFEPTALEGYFNDLTGKVAWTAEIDAAGIPQHGDARGKLFYFPITIAQKGLGHWDQWLLSGRKDDAAFRAAVGIGKWLLADQDENGGWRCWDRMRAATVSPYSAMAQGQGISLLVRLHAQTGAAEWLDAATRAHRFLNAEAGDTSVVRTWRGLRLLEEYPKSRVNGVLNGWIFAAFGLHDYALATRDASAHRAAREAFHAIDYSVSAYDTGAWSAYDLEGRIASPFYHHLHVAQLTALALAYPEGRTIRTVCGRFDAYRGSTLRTVRAISRKVVQKFRERDYEVLA